MNRMAILIGMVIATTAVWPFSATPALAQTTGVDGCSNGDCLPEPPGGAAGGVGVGVGVSVDVESIVPKRIVPRFRSGNEPPPPRRLVYAVKFLCGTLLPEAGSGQFPDTTQSHLLVPGTYMTAVNLHNPFRAPVDFSATAVVTMPYRRQGPGGGGTPPRGRVREAISPDHGLEIDCVDILTLLDGSGSPAEELKTQLHKGFLIIESAEDLDVVAVYAVKNVEAFTAVPRDQ